MQSGRIEPLLGFVGCNGWGLLDPVSLVLRESDVEESRIALVGASAELFGGKAAGRDSTPLPPP